MRNYILRVDKYVLEKLNESKFRGVVPLHIKFLLDF